jgi:hypothetical protein
VIPLRAQVKRRQGGSYLAFESPVAVESVEAAIIQLKAIPGDRLRVEEPGNPAGARYVVAETDRGIVAIPLPA